MAPFWAQTIAAEPSTNNKRAARAAKDEPIVSPNNRDIFKISSSGKSRPYILLNPEASEKLYGMVQRCSGRGPCPPRRGRDALGTAGKMPALRCCGLEREVRSNLAKGR